MPGLIHFAVNSPRSFTSVLRLLLLFSSFQFKNGRSLTQIRTKSDSAWATLGQKKRASDCRISFADVRDCFLQIEGMGPSRTNVPRPHWNISTGDIGYVKDDNFVLIANVFDDDTPTFCGDTPGLGASHEEILMIRCDPCRPYNLTELPDGSKRYVFLSWLIAPIFKHAHHYGDRYEFDAPAFALLWHSHRFGIDDRLAMKYLLRHANFYLEKSGLSHRLNPSDIIMGTQTLYICVLICGRSSYASVYQLSIEKPDHVTPAHLISYTTTVPKKSPQERCTSLRAMILCQVLNGDIGR